MVGVPSSSNYQYPNKCSPFNIVKPLFTCQVGIWLKYFAYSRMILATHAQQLFLLSSTWPNDNNINCALRVFCYFFVIYYIILSREQATQIKRSIINPWQVKFIWRTFNVFAFSTVYLNWDGAGDRNSTPFVPNNQYHSCLLPYDTSGQGSSNYDFDPVCTNVHSNECNRT